MTTPTSPKTNHAEEALRLVGFVTAQAASYRSPFEADMVALTEAQVHATLALVEQQQIANLIALATITDGALSEQVAVDARHALAEFIDHDDEDLGGWLELRQTIAARLDLAQDVTP